MYQPNVAKLSSGMEALIASIKSGETKITTPDGGLTVAAKHMAAQLPQGPQPGMTPPPQGSATPEGGIAGIAQNAATGIDINQMKQKQAEQAMMQMAQQQQQQQPTQMMASGGIAGLPADNMHSFAEGGILGFNGKEEQGSEVKSKSLLDRFPKEALIHNIAEYLSRSNDMVGNYDTEQRIPGQLIRSIPEIPQMPLPERAIVEGEQNTPPAARAAASPERMVARPERAAARTQSNEGLPSVQYGAKPEQYDTGMTSGIGGILPTAPATAESPEIAAMREKATRIQALNKARPDYYAQNIAALDADKEARAKAAAEQQKRRGFDAFMALVGSKGGIGGMGEASTQFNKGVISQQDAVRQANLLDAQMRVKLGELEHARQIGDVNSEIGIEKEIAGIKHQMAQVAEVSRGHTLTYNAATSGHELTAKTAANRLAQEVTEGAKERANRIAIAGMGQASVERKENLTRFLQEMKDAQIDKLNDEINALERIANTPDSKKKLTDLVTKRDAVRDAVLKRFPGMTKDDIPANFGGGAAAGSAVLKYNPKTGKVE